MSFAFQINRAFILCLIFLQLIFAGTTGKISGKVVDEKMIKVHNRKRLNTTAIKQMIAYHKDYHYKPVWDGTDENLKEIEDYRIELGIPKDKTFVMPAGDTRETLVEMYPKVFEMVAEHGYNMTGRDHIIAYNTERGV